MKIGTKFRVTVPQNEVWEIITNPQNACKTIPGCESVEQIDNNTYLSIVNVNICLIKARFKLISKLVEDEVSFNVKTYTTWKGINIFSNATQTTSLRMRALGNSSTEITLDSELKATGTLAKFGNKLMHYKAQSVAEEWVQGIKSLCEESSEQYLDQMKIL